MAFWDRMNETIEKGLEASKEWWGKARETAKDLSEKGVLKLEIAQLERQAQNEFARLGSRVYEAFVQNEQKTLSSGSPQIKEVISEIQDIRERIEKREKRLREL